ncbi:hypothetical protein HK413_01735 [Mucilaginibacter sp. S1162]|uniref:Uncharacterized protein n=1 Tax=Mucilaginibacter humi TaxID=2732510 RepID=A0ABX1W3P8_9SPHI|nr:hypothetical protein [Mucilaginibacter humi]
MLFVIHSCKKNFNGNDADAQITDPEVLNAKTWYEETYPINRIDKSGLQTNGVQEVDVSQKIKPDWQRPSHYKRFNDDVIEIPLDPSAKFNAVLKNTDYNKELNTPEQSRSSFLMLKNNGKYDAYIMTIIGDADYLKGDVAKLARNTYSKRDTNFSGLVFYFTPKGRYLSGYRYKNGHQLKPQQASLQRTQNVKLKTNNNIGIECYDIITTITTNGRVTDQYVSNSFCIVYEGGEDPPPSGGGSSSGGSGGNNSPVPPQCPPGTVVNSVHLQVNGNAPPGEEPTDGPGDPGFPPPTPPSEQQCMISIPVPDTAASEVFNNLTNPVKPCALKFKNVTSNWMAVGVSGYKLGIQDNVFGTKFITFNLQIGMPNTVSIQQAQAATAAAMLVAEATIANTHGVDFFLSAGAQPKYSKEFATIVQAQLIVELNLPSVQVQNSISPGVRIITYADNNCN